MKKTLIVALFAMTLVGTATAQLDPQQALNGMTRGINLGNTLESPLEGEWNGNGPAQEYYFDDFKAAGFTTVRVPVRWDKHTADSAPYAIDGSWLDRVEQVIDWALERDFIVILNAHHEDWLKHDYDNADLRARFDSIWTQVAFRYQDKSDSLLFEIINEPYGMSKAQNDDLNARILPIIRETNPTRIVIYSGHEWASAATYMQAAIPEDDYLMGYYHSYDPWDFCGLANGTWGSTTDKSFVRSQFESVGTFATTNGIPTMISEFGAIRSADLNSRMRVYAFYVEQALRNNIAFHAWDDGGDFKLYNREERTWSDEKDILIHTQIDGPTDLTAVSVGDTLVEVSWLNRIARNDSISVQRRLLNGPFETIAVVDKLASAFTDTTVVGGNRYRYRVISWFANGKHAYSYPQEVEIVPTQRSYFLGEPFVIPGTIQAEDYDVGGEGLTYHDSDFVNTPNAYRPDEAVDIEARTDGGFHVGYVEPGEWMEYTVDVEEAGTYTITAHVASLDGGGRLTVKIGEASVGMPRIPDTDSWMTLAPISKDIELEAGPQVMRLTIFATPFYNIDRIVLTKSTSTGLGAIDVGQRFEVYPNPVESRLRIDSEVTNASTTVDIVNILGQIVASGDFKSDETELDVATLPSGVYFVRISSDNRLLHKSSFVKR